jgi:hypothetical protein
MSSFIHLATGVPSLTNSVESLTMREDVPEPMGKVFCDKPALTGWADELPVDESDVIGFGGIRRYSPADFASKKPAPLVWVYAHDR